MRMMVRRKRDGAMIIPTNTKNTTTTTTTTSTAVNRDTRMKSCFTNKDVDNGKRSSRSSTSTRQHGDGSFSSQHSSNSESAISTKHSALASIDDPNNGSSCTPNTQQVTTTSTDGGGSNKATTSSTAAATRGKQVRFKDVRIRDYERIVSDNPCCSSGPPVGIGWAHGEITVIDLDSYEQRRHGRRESSEMVLTRHERENLLKSWDIQPDVVASAIRSTIRVKNQRRQTVRNLRKATIEENVEKAKRALKKAFLLRRGTDEEFRKLQRQAFVAADLLARVQVDTIREEGEPSSSSPRPAVIICEDDAVIAEKVFSDNDIGSDESVASPTISEDRDYIADGNGENIEIAQDERSRSSGLTQSNSTTESMKEMENFYKELEADLFGSQELPPYLVGQTIELCDESVSTQFTDSTPHQYHGDARDGANEVDNYPDQSNKAIDQARGTYTGISLRHIEGDIYRHFQHQVSSTSDHNDEHEQPTAEIDGGSEVCPEDDECTDQSDSKAKSYARGSYISSPYIVGDAHRPFHHHEVVSSIVDCDHDEKKQLSHARGPGQDATTVDKAATSQSNKAPNNAPGTFICSPHMVGDYHRPFHQQEVCSSSYYNKDEEFTPIHHPKEHDHQQQQRQQACRTTPHPYHPVNTFFHPPQKDHFTLSRARKSSSPWELHDLRPRNDEPRVYHVPLHSYRSPTDWMEGLRDDDDCQKKVHSFKAVTITETIEEHHGHLIKSNAR